MRRRRILAAAFTLALLAGAGAAAFVLLDSSEPRREAAVPEGGSRLGARQAEKRERGLLGVLSNLIARSAPEAADPVRKRVAGPPGSAAALAARIPPSRLAAVVLLAGFEGQDMADPFFERLRSRDFGGVVLEKRNFAYPDQVASLSASARSIAQQSGHLPPMILAASAQEFGEGGLPVESELASAGEPDTGRMTAATAGTALKTLGVDALLGPSLDVSVSGAAGEERAFSDVPAVVVRWGRAVVAGLGEAGVSSIPKHFPGQGTVAQDPLQGPTFVGLQPENLKARDLRPFRALLGEAPAVVVSNAIITAIDPVTPASQSPAVVGDLLRGELRFRGAAIADNVLGASAASGLPPGQAAVAALAAGCDLVYTRDQREQEQSYRAILAALRRGELSQARLREAAARVIELKRRLGLFATTEATPPAA